jgi:glyoxylase-like metal-dependent hydrolase (beta-lactamase superfamily II)
MKERGRVLSRRNFLADASRLGAACAAAHWMPEAVQAQSLADDPRIASAPLVDRGFAAVRRIGEGVYATISDRSKGLETRCNGGFIVGRDAALLVEGFQTPAGASFQIEALRMVSQVPIRAAINSHFHFDHSLGNSAYGARDIPIWAHARVPERMTQRYPLWQREDLATFLAPWQMRVSEAKTDAQRRHAQSDIEGLSSMFVPVSQYVLSLPNHLLEPTRLPVTVDLGGLSAVIETYLGHTDTDLIVRVPERNVVYAGDLVVNAQYPTNIDGYPTPWRATLEKLAAFDKDTIFVPGHGQLCGLEGVALLRAVFDDIAGQAEKLYKAGVPVEEATESYAVPDRFRHFRQFSWGFTVGRTIEQLYAAWGGQPGPILNY